MSVCCLLALDRNAFSLGLARGRDWAICLENKLALQGKKQRRSGFAEGAVWGGVFTWLPGTLCLALAHGFG